MEFANNNSIEIVSVVDVWWDILEEFLDTQFSDEAQEKTLLHLEKQGVSRYTCESLRKRLEKTMLSYNIDSCLWEWIYLGLYDVLSACSGELVALEYKLEEKEFAEFYKLAMDIANKGFHLEKE